MSDYAGQKNVWVYNDLDADDCYVYWMTPLDPGETTGLALQNVTLIKQPNGAFYYAVHVDMEAVSPDQLSLWTGVPQKIMDALIANG
jgi:hypothetical protein